MSAAFVPDSGDLIWLTFDPQAGREQAGPALVRPITSQAKGYPFEMDVPAGQGVARRFEGKGTGGEGRRPAK